MKRIFIMVLSLAFFLSGCGILAKPEPAPPSEPLQPAKTQQPAEPEPEQTPAGQTIEPENGGKTSELTEERIGELLAISDDRPFSDFSAETLEGGTLDTKDFRGEVLVVNLMATWCGWCVYELPSFAEAIKRFEGEDVSFVGIDVWEDFSNDKYKTELKSLLDEAGVDMPVLIDNDGRYANALRIQGIPYTMIVDREGIVRFTNPGAFMSSGDLIDMVDIVLYHSDRF
ncbi:MAG: Thiol-disulfide oxidoreductase ResA [Firmicutes bacterium ADurb.Bin182]|nr:MAG: Thiol-disulfide oxidoreductase ResA [Firmicutes bacterium ADurb.Bin182]